VQGNDNILDLVKLVQPAALIPLMNAEIESSGDDEGFPGDGLSACSLNIATFVHDMRRASLSEQS